MINNFYTRFLVLLLITPWCLLASTKPLYNGSKDTFSINLKWYHQFQSAGYYAAVKKGFYKDAGLVVCLVEGSPTTTSVQGVMSGRTDFGVSGVDILQYYLRGENFVALAALFQHSPLVMMALEKKAIRYAADFAGKKVMISNGPGGNHFMNMLQNEGISRDKVRIVEHSWNLNDLIDGTVDAMAVYVTDEPYRMRKRGIEFTLIDIQEYGIDYYGDILFCNKTTVTQYPQQVKAIRSASIRGWEYAFENIDEMIAYILTLPGVSNRGVTADYLRYEAQEMKKLVMPEVIEIGHINESRLQHIADAITLAEDVKKKRSLDSFIYNPNPVISHKVFYSILAGILFCCGVGFLIFFFVNRMLAREVSKKTRALKAELLEKEAIEKALRESELQYRTLADFGQALIWKAGTDKKCTYFNKPWLTFTGRSLAMELGDGWTSGVHKDDLDRCIQTYKTAFDKKEPFSIDYRLLRFDGEYRWILDNGTPLYDSTGVFLGFLGHCLDVTESKEAEKTLHTLMKLESLGVLAGGIAHDFNNLLSGIYGFVDLASRSNEPVETAEYMSATMKTLDRARALTHQLLTFSKGGAPVRTTQILEPFIRETVQFALCGSNVQSRFCIDSLLWPCNFDKNQLGQVIDNLVINAKQAMPQGGVLTIRAENMHVNTRQHLTLKEGDYVLISVQDSGTGISPDAITKIFDLYFTTKAQGHGLGLATCYSIITRHGGAIDVESTEGLGSTFFVYLPALPGTDTVESITVSQNHKGCGTIIVMDDEEIIRDMFKAVLNRLGYSVLLMNNGNEVIEYFENITHDKKTVKAIILDLTIPGSLGGKETISKLREMNSTIPTFVSSGYADDPIMADPTSFGFTASISKPFKISEIAQMLQRHLPASSNT